MEPLDDELLSLLDLESGAEGIFVGAPERAQRTRVYGGHLLGQALAAASFTVAEGACHSMHAYFVRPGIPGRPTEYEVSAFQDGRRSSTRQVIGVQRDEVILQLVASFARASTGPELQTAPLAPAGPPEESAPSEGSPSWPIQMIRADDDARAPASTRLWMRAPGRLPDDPNLHRCVLAYASDLGALRSCAEAVGENLSDGTLQAASLDHAIWFHRNFRADEWLLFDYQAACVAGGRGLSRGTVMDRSGALVASMAQEGLLAHRQPAD